MFEVYKCHACMYFGEFEAGAKIALRFGPNGYSGKYPGFAFGLDYLPFGLCLYHMARKTKLAKYRRLANQTRNDVKKLVKAGCVNLVHQLSLLDAEYHAMNGKLDLAKSSYDKAVIEAARGGFLQDAAVSSERYADFLLMNLRNRESEADGSYRLKESIKYYTEWGAKRKVEQLYQDHSTLLASTE